VFEDLGLPESAERLVKFEIAARISSIIERRGLTQVQAAKVLDVDQADVSDLVRGKLAGFSTDRLFRFLNALGQDVDIVMPRRLHARRAGHLRVVDEQRGRCGRIERGSTRTRRFEVDWTPEEALILSESRSITRVP